MTEPESNVEGSEINWKARRRSRFVSSQAALNQIGAAFANHKLKTRVADKVTNILLICSIVVMATLVLFPGQAAIMVIGDFLFGLTLLFYIMQRMGIFSTFDERQTLLSAQLLFSMMWFGVFLGVNVVAFLVILKEVVTAHGNAL